MKYDVDKINLEIEDVDFFGNGFAIRWSSNIGFGEYTIKKENGKLMAYPEFMDSNEDKTFIL